MTLPGTGRSLDQFRYDDSVCRQFAFDQIGGERAGAAAEDATARSAILGTALGAVAGAAIGGSDGAAAGAGVGLLGGTAIGAGRTHDSSWSLQRRYDHAYVQCMYAAGHRVPVAGRFTGSGRIERLEQGPYSPPPAPGTAARSAAPPAGSTVQPPASAATPA
ncbi:MAG TPA: hypothetical protein VM491_20800, partial [Burkholderiaceae bacterium]|nr:hypothetical protein [Burkholderiaceae bacterium]